MSTSRFFSDLRGDTIIEVLIAIVILTLILTGAYQTADSSYKRIVDAQQRIQAVDVEQTEVEDLRAQAAQPSFEPYKTGNSCFQISTSSTTNNLPTAYDSNAAPTGTCVAQGLFLSEVSYIEQSPDAPVGVYEYQITVTWPSIINGNSRVTLYYRVDT